MKLFVWNGLKGCSTGHIFALAEDVEQARQLVVEWNAMPGREADELNTYRHWVADGAEDDGRNRQSWLDIQAEPNVFGDEPVVFFEYGCD